MPLRNPSSGETEREWMSYCMRELGDRPHDQKLAICLGRWRGDKIEDDGKGALTPEHFRLPRMRESYDDFMQNCMDALDTGRGSRSVRERESVCRVRWGQRRLMPREELAELLNKAANMLEGKEQT